jgi:hypothetical protein
MITQPITLPITQPITPLMTVTQLIILQIHLRHFVLALRLKDLVCHKKLKKPHLNSHSKILEKLLPQEDCRKVKTALTTVPTIALTTALTATPIMRTVKRLIIASLGMNTALQTAKMMALAMISTSTIYQLQVTSSKTTGDTTQPLVPETFLTQSKTLTRL